MRSLSRRGLPALGLLAFALAARPPCACAEPKDIGWESRVHAYEMWIRRPSLEKRTKGRLQFAATKDPRARDILIASYAKPEEPADHVRHLLVSIVTEQFGSADDVPALAAWRAANAKAEDAWLWHRTFEVERRAIGQKGAIEAVRNAPNAVLQAAAMTVVEGDEPEVLKLLSEVMTRAVAEHGAFERALLVEACADALSKQRAMVGKPEFHDAGMKVIRVLDDPMTIWRTKIVVARRLATTFGKVHAVLDWKYWHRLLLLAEGAEQEPVIDDRYAPPSPPTFGGVPASGKRIVYLIDCSDSMLAPISVKEITELKEPKRGPVTPGDDAGKPPPPPPTEPAPDEKPADEPLEGCVVDWKKVKTRFDAAREMLKASVKGLPKDASFAVVFFGSKAELAKSTPGMTNAGALAAGKLAGEINGMRAGRPTALRKFGTLMGDTNVHGAFRKAFKLKETGLTGPNEHVREDAFLQGCDTIFLLSDGDPSLSDWVILDKRDEDDRVGDPETGTPLAPTPDLWQHGPYSQERWILDDLRRMNLLRRVEIHVVGIGEASGAFLQEIAAIGEGRVRLIANGERIEEKKK